jgi:predicted DNA-binding ribbon-helix-helix protein
MSKLEVLERLVESQKQTIEMLEMQLRNERLKNGNLASLYRGGNGVKSMED